MKIIAFLSQEELPCAPDFNVDGQRSGLVCWRRPVRFSERVIFFDHLHQFVTFSDKITDEKQMS